MFASIAVCVDGSQQAETAFETAVDLARRTKARLLILTVASAEYSRYLAGPAPPSETEMQRHYDLVNACLKRAETAGVAEAGFDVLQGNPADAILDHLERDPVDLLIVGARGLSRAQRFMLGSVSSALAIHAPCSVLVIRPPSAPHPPKPAAAPTSAAAGAPKTRKLASRRATTRERGRRAAARRRRPSRRGGRRAPRRRSGRRGA